MALSQNVVTETLLTIGYILVFLAVFVADAIFMPYKLKMLVILLIVISTTIANGYIFLSIDDQITRWNPIENALPNNSSWRKYTQYATVYFKSLEMSALSNLALFSAKPIFALLWKKFRSCISDLDESESQPINPKIRYVITNLLYIFNILYCPSLYNVLMFIK